MINNKDYIRLSLELHLFFARIMKEHSFFLEAAFMVKDEEYKKIANDFQELFGKVLEQVVDLANGNISKEILLSQEIVTNSTLTAEKKSSELSGIIINSNITIKELDLKPGNIDESSQIIRAISDLNIYTLRLISNLIYFKQEILTKVLECKLFTGNYPLLITHIINEAKMYYQLLEKIEKREIFNNAYIYEQEIFWNNIMKEHAEFIRGLLDPSEKDLLLTANKYVIDYEKILVNYKNNPNVLTSISLEETLSFKTFKEAGEDGILNCKIKSIIIPLLADHVLREANHFIKLLRNFSNK